MGQLTRPPHKGPKEGEYATKQVGGAPYTSQQEIRVLPTAAHADAGPSHSSVPYFSSVTALSYLSEKRSYCSLMHKRVRKTSLHNGQT